VSDHDSTPEYRLVVLGARGSIPVSGPEFTKYGGSTTCIAIARGSSVWSFFDAGTGVMAFPTFGLELTGSIPVFLTHYHWDHIQGVSMLGEVWTGACSFTFHGPDNPRTMLTEAIRPPWFPVSLDDAPEPVAYITLDGPVDTGPIRVTSFLVQHPQGAVGYRIDGPTASVAIVTDHESTPACDDVIAEAIQGVDVLFHDAQYLPSEVEEHVGWGHSTWENAVAMAKRTGANQLVLTSHDPRRTDDDIDAMVADARVEFENTIAASPGLELPL
jgi:ribonuclease BN (tRNA processing enzyme)